MAKDTTKSNTAREYPLLPLRGQVVFPYMTVPLEVGREKSISALDEAMAQDRRMVLVMQRDSKVDDPTAADIFTVGTLVEVKQVVRVAGGTMKVVFEGLARVRIKKYLSEEPHFRVQAEERADVDERTSEAEALMRSLIHAYEQFIKASKKVPPEALVSVISVEEPGRLADVVANHLNLKVEDKQAVLEAIDVKDRLEKVHDTVSREMELLELEKKINVRVRKQMERTQKEYYLREQMKAIQKELGERDEKGTESDEFRTKLEELGMPQEAKEKALREVERLEKMPPMAAEAVVVRNYLEWLVALPWSASTDDNIDLDQAERVLEEDHHGLKRVKERIVEYLAIRKLVDQIKGPILCLVGPPGVGKTSLAKSVARAMNRKFVRVSLGGVRDEAEVRGHRRTYVGAMPGRVIQGMRTAGSHNPVFLLDEIDKMNADFRGDPSSALLEVLDPEQNANFSDHYIEMPFDLSRVMFITTANVAYNIPRPLLDRMEVIHISGYTEDEKVEIAKRHLLPKQLKDHGIKTEQLEISENVLRLIIREYTREAGVRNLERELANICRKTARELVKGESAQVRVSTQSLHKYLGSPRFTWGRAEEEDEVGVALGLSVTEAGGDVMPIEVTLMKGKGDLLLTGKLGEVMKESAQAGFSYIRSRAEQLGIAEDFHEKVDIHVHVPEGAIPKDGPSAGITMATAVVSALTGRPVRRDVAMTGEITLRGRVLPIGGLKEKILAAHRAGVTTVILPKENKKDLEDVPVNVARKLDFVLVSHMDEVLPVALLPLASEPELDATIAVPMGDVTGIDQPPMAT
ncbi:MAG: endopeptidase La [Symbiobacteriia bacterium]